jgi:hypothetical protein
MKYVFKVKLFMPHISCSTLIRPFTLLCIRIKHIFFEKIVIQANYGIFASQFHGLIMDSASSNVLNEFFQQLTFCDAFQKNIFKQNVSKASV